MFTTLPVVAFPAIDPVAVQFGPLAIRWYALAYVAGIVIGWRLAMRLAAQPGSPVRPREIDDLVVWLTLGIILGGRVGYVLFYNFDVYIHDPLAALRVWEGGMSFHGGLIGVVLAIILFARNRGIPLLGLGDVVAMVTPIGLFFGRIANFVNGELWGRATDVSWAMVFPRDEAHLPRHPSQLYEAALEGVVLFILLMILNKRGIRRNMGAMSGSFLILYAAARIFSEFFREPDAQLGFLAFGVTMGQILSIPMALIGLWMLVTAKGRPAPDRNIEDEGEKKAA
ncbi:MAG: prolipoprotein diacylglyceryl transferase [Zavarzinia sp.]|nr:prolipoprotein diacylglyceryl transferase [Zavarzinia sp.]